MGVCDLGPMWSDHFGPKWMCMTVHSIVLYNMAPIWYYWVSPIWSDLLRFGQIWSDLVIRVTHLKHISENITGE